ncbi:hypothetical protein [Bathymodiolus platifrons methanotrophic gill symbiont]|uniref:hypothetical protein n=1 Tax=Bathymodiolus platifrons methanotrophic gill symbiont TaxID=113268 RepID=UPI001C8E5098|nr:hypothetical protein [Bathymodiolus platifrons methanotrophic gill symbiont]
MKVLVLNSGSSSLKFQLFTLDSLDNDKCQLLASGLIEQIGETQSSSQIEFRNEQQLLENVKQTSIISDHQQALELMTKECARNNFLKQPSLNNEISPLN